MNEKYDLCDIDESYLHTVSMTELFDSAYQSKPPIIDGLLYRGTYLFAGSPKIGKSFLMAQLAYHVSTGTNLWGFDVRQGKVLYLALEDNYPRLQKRLYRMFGTAENENLFFSVSAHQLGNGLDEQIDGFLQKHPDTSLVIIDTLQKVREVGGENYSYANDYQIINNLNGRLYSENKSLNHENSRLKELNNQLREQNKAYRLLEKVFGKHKLNEVIEQARGYKKSKQRDAR